MAPIYEFNEEQVETVESLKLGKRRQDLELNQLAELTTQNWVVIPRDFSRFEYDLQVNPARLCNSSAIKKVVKTLKLNNYLNTAIDSLGREFVGENNWVDSLKLNLSLGFNTPNLVELREYARLLYQGMKGKIVYDASGNKINSIVLRRYLDDIFEPHLSKGEWIDINFRVNANKTRQFLISNHTLNAKGDLVPRIFQQLSGDFQREDMRMNLESWLFGSTSQGLPTRVEPFNEFYPSDNFPSKDFSYYGIWYYKNRVSALDTGRGKSCLRCNLHPDEHYSDLGVRSVKRIA